MPSTKQLKINNSFNIFQDSKHYRPGCQLCGSEEATRACIAEPCAGGLAVCPFKAVNFRENTVLKVKDRS